MPDESIWEGEEESELTEREDSRSDLARGSVEDSGARKRPPRKPDSSRSVSSGSASETSDRSGASAEGSDAEMEVVESAPAESPSGASPLPEGLGADDVCPRWMYHQKGVWCKTCFRTPTRDGVPKGWSLEGKNMGISEGMTVKTNFKAERKPKKRGNR